ncbi:MAG: adenylate/guanylate cyclase domain-containing protein [Cyanobacteria bacterium P01_C01_bin.89]
MDVNNARSKVLALRLQRRLTNKVNDGHNFVGSFFKALYSKTILCLSILFAVAVFASMWNVSHLTEVLVQTQALQNAKLYAQSLTESRSLYSAEVVKRAVAESQTEASHDYAMHPGNIPLPATFLIELGERIRGGPEDISVRLYSSYPFPWRKETGGPKNKFEEEALTALTKNPQEPFYRLDRSGNSLTFSYAQADVLRPSCVGCHNTYPGTPKTDWKVGDVRGILEIVQPLDAIAQRTQRGLRDLFLMLGILSCLALVGIGIVIARLRSISQELERRVVERTAQLQTVNSELAEAQEKSERLLLNILPASIAKRLKEGENQIAQSFPEATILFADIVGFTELSQRVGAQQLVDFLNQIFSGFDTLCDQYSLEKIKTIGDAYMVVGGLPERRDDHAEGIADMAIAMQHQIRAFNYRNETKITIRIGVHTGPVVAGVIGQKKFIYDLWGDSVNIASRMESHGVAGKIQVSEVTYELLKGEYHLEFRGNIKVKGKGKMNAYFLNHRLPRVVNRPSFKEAFM